MTRGMINAAAFDKMKQGTLLVNASRGDYRHAGTTTSAHDVLLLASRFAGDAGASSL